MKKLTLVIVLIIVFTFSVVGQQNDCNLRRKVLESAVGTWYMSNDTITFQIQLMKCKKAYGHDTVDGVCGNYKCIKKINSINTTSEGSNLNGSNAYTDTSRFPITNIGIFFYDEVKKKSTTGTINVVGDTLYWSIRPYTDTYTLTVNGKYLGGPRYPKGWSVPIKATLIRVRKDKEKSCSK